MPAKPKIETNNREWGFYGTAFQNAHLLDHQCEKIYSQVANALAERFGMTPTEAVTFLDGKDGRHLADSLTIDGEVQELVLMPRWLMAAANDFLNASRGRVAPTAPTVPKTRQASIPALCVVLSKVLTDEQVAGILNALVSCEAEPTLSDAEADLGGAIFDQLCLLRPEAVAVAQGGQ